MRCLYCGKELALLKRWTGGGEFCSDGHRQQYQEEYNQLALTRLLQAKPREVEVAPAPPKAAVARAEPAAVPQRAGKVSLQPAQPTIEARIETPAPSPKSKTRRIEAPKPEPVPEPEPEIAFEPEPEPEPEPEVVAEQDEPAPAGMMGFLVDMPLPAMAAASAIARSDAQFERGTSPALPHRQYFDWETQLVAAGPVEATKFSGSVNTVFRSSERRLEIRDFARTMPVLEVELEQACEPVVPAMSEEHMEILIFPRPPQGSPPVWTEGWREFAFEERLGALARVAFRTTGLEDNEDASDPIGQDIGGDSDAEIDASIDADRDVESIAETAQFLPETERAPVVAEAKVEPQLEEAAPKLMPTVAPAAPTPAPQPVTELPQTSGPVNIPLPLTWRGVPAGRGKPVQVFSAVASGVDVHIPRSSALPLRPVMTLGPAPTVSAPTATATAVKAPEKVADRTMVVKVDPKPAQPGRPDPRFANGKARKEQGTPEIEKKAQKPVTPAAREAVKAPEKVEKPAEKPPEKMVAAKPVEPPAPKSPARTADKPRESSLPAPMASPYTPPDLGLPSLSLDTSGGFWGRLPIAGKLGLVATVIGLILGVMFTIKSAAGTSAASGPQVVSSPLADDGQWLLDWGTEPGVRRTHDIYIRKSSLTLSDYRVEFQEQMENRALGWVYRARDSKNYYVCKLEVVKPGAEPGVALVRYAVVNGEEQPRTQIPLTFSPPVHLDTIYKIRFEALGSHFTTWAQDQKIDDWTDDRFKVGGVGLFNEHGAKPVTLNLSLLVIKK